MYQPRSPVPRNAHRMDTRLFPETLPEGFQMTVVDIHQVVHPDWSRSTRLWLRCCLPRRASHFLCLVAVDIIDYWAYTLEEDEV